jgi:hypothetical protein
MSGRVLAVVYNKDDSKLASFSKDILNLIGRNKNFTSIKTFDVREPPVQCELCIHLCEPYAVWFPWSKMTCLIIDEWNNEWVGYNDSLYLKIHKSEVNAESLSQLIDEHYINFIEENGSFSPPLPPLLKIEDCPHISVITLVYNRPKFIENACLNLLSTDYPKDKIEWIVVDDSEADKSPSNRVVQFQGQFPGVVTYIPLTKKTSIGAKRNMAIERAKNDVILMMDDDDHYPVTSFRRRVAYLTKGLRAYGCAVCTAIAMYDLNTGVSAVNVPPFDISLGKRCSEATLTFTKEFWLQKKFPEVDISEGEGFLEGREWQVAEMPLQQIIVALSHSTNTSRRKTPVGDPGCFWGFPKELLEFLHGLVGVKIEAV